MLNKQLFERYGFLVIALEFMTLGIIFTIHAKLGITPISCPPYVLSLAYTWTVGEFTIAMHVIFVLIQILLLRSRYDPIQLFQLILGLIFGTFIDINNYFFGDYYPSTYLGKFIFVVLGSLCVAIGISIEVVIKTIVVAGEGVVIAIIDVFKFPLGKTKIAFDVTLLTIALIFSLKLFRRVEGIREGTIYSAFLVGFFAGYLKPIFAPFILNILYRNCPEKINEENFNNHIFIDDEVDKNIKDSFLLNESKESISEIHVISNYVKE